MTGFLSRRLLRTGLRRGLAGSNPWLAIGLLAGVVRFVRHGESRRSRVVFREALQPGDTLRIAALSPASAAPEEPDLPSE